MVGDGQVSAGSTIVKTNARKVRRLGTRREIVAGFAGSVADAFALFERLEMKLEEHGGQLLRSCVELAKAWRTERYFRNLQATMIVADKDVCLELSGDGNVLEFDNVVAIGSGGGYALAAARALRDIEGLDAETIARKSMDIASSICVYTNTNYVIETLDLDEGRVTDDTNMVVPK